MQNIKTKKQISDFLNKIVDDQNSYEQKIKGESRKKKGVFLTNSLTTIEDILSVIDIENNIFSKKILEPSCGQGIFLLKLIVDIYSYCPNDIFISTFISKNIYFIDIQEEMINKTKNNIRILYYFLFDKKYTGTFNGYVSDFTTKRAKALSLFDNNENNFEDLYNTFDYVIGNPPYVTLYGRRDKKENEEQRIKYLRSYKQFPDNIKNGKINLVMLFLEHSLDFLKTTGKLSFIIDVSFFETAYKYTRKYLLENTTIDELHTNITNFDVASGQIILKLTKSKSNNNEVKIIDNKSKKSYYILQSNWYNMNDEYKFRYNGNQTFKLISDKIMQKKEKNILELFPNKNLRTCVMLLNMEDEFTFIHRSKEKEYLIYPYYQGSKSLSDKFGTFSFSKYFYYNKTLQDDINNKLKIELEKQGIKNKKRLGLGETIIYDNPKIFIRQSAKEIIASLDTKKSSANNSLYVFSLRDSSQESLDFLYFLCGFLNSDFVTYYAQQMNIIRFSQGKQPQIKIKDLGSIPIPQNIDLRNIISKNCKRIYNGTMPKEEAIKIINAQIFTYYGLTSFEINSIYENIKSF